MWTNFHVRVPGKWVLAGEHAVLRGATAVALPHPEFSLELTFQPQVWSQPWATEEEFLKVAPDSASPLINEFLEGLKSEAAQKGATFPAPRGSLLLESSIPVGAGLGSSAALCVAFTRWVAGPLGLEEADLFEFARRLEDRFHGRSSGMDVAATSQGRPIVFTMAGGARPLEISKLPRFTFHDTGLRSRTSECVAKVNVFREAQPGPGEKLDQQMSEAAELAASGLLRYPIHAEEGLESLVRAMNLARGCFQGWDLVPPQIQKLEAELLKQGALAVKLTGAGAGGYVVALWKG
jgi:mevalonate kinase